MTSGPVLAQVVQGPFDYVKAILVVLIVLVLIIVPAYAVRRMRREASGAQWEALLDIAVERAGAGGDLGPTVTFKFHTYSGFLVHFTQREHEPTLPAPIALKYLWQLHRYNLAGCTVPYPGMAFVPLLSTVNYLVQRRAINKVVRTAKAAEVVNR